MIKLKTFFFIFLMLPLVLSSTTVRDELKTKDIFPDSLGRVIGTAETPFESLYVAYVTGALLGKADSSLYSDSSGVASALADFSADTFLKNTNDTGNVLTLTTLNATTIKAYGVSYITMENNLYMRQKSISMLNAGGDEPVFIDTLGIHISGTTQSLLFGNEAKDTNTVRIDSTGIYLLDYNTQDTILAMVKTMLEYKSGHSVFHIDTNIQGAYYEDDLGHFTQMWAQGFYSENPDISSYLDIYVADDPEESYLKFKGGNVYFGEASATDTDTVFFDRMAPLAGQFNYFFWLQGRGIILESAVRCDSFYPTNNGQDIYFMQFDSTKSFTFGCDESPMESIYFTISREGVVSNQPIYAKWQIYTSSDESSYVQSNGLYGFRYFGNKNSASVDGMVFRNYSNNTGHYWMFLDDSDTAIYEDKDKVINLNRPMFYTEAKRPISLAPMQFLASNCSGGYVDNFYLYIFSNGADKFLLAQGYVPLDADTDTVRVVWDYMMSTAYSPAPGSDSTQLYWIKRYHVKAPADTMVRPVVNLYEASSDIPDTVQQYDVFSDTLFIPSVSPGSFIQIWLYRRGTDANDLYPYDIYMAPANARIYYKKHRL